MIEPPAAKLLLTVEEAAAQLAIGRSLAYELVLRGELPSVRIGRCRRIACADLKRFVDGLRDQALDLENQSSDRSETKLNPG